MNQDPKVSVCMITYGHEKFIEQAINGVLMQECYFEVELIIANDCSPDKTDEVVKNILENHPRASWIKYTKHNENLGMMPNFIFALQQCKGEFIAVCEGDDYWTDPLKLQKQVDFMDHNSEYAICWTKFSIVDESEKSQFVQEPVWVEQLNERNNVDLDLHSIFTPYCTYTLTVLFRRQSLDISLFNKLKYAKDNSLYAICLGKGKGALLNFYSSVYRLHQGGVYSSVSKFSKNYYSYLNLNEIVEKIPYCNNLNIRNIRNHLLSESIKTHPNHLSFQYLYLTCEGFIFLGIKKNLVLLIHNIKKIKFGK